MKRLKETIIYYVVCLWMNTWVYNNIFRLIDIMNDCLNSCMSKEDAKRTVNLNIFKYIPSTYKNKIINEKFN